MDAKEYLRKVYRVDEITKAHTQELKRLKEFAAFESLTPEIKSKMEGLRNQINQDIERNVTMWAEVRKTIDEVENTNEKAVLTLRYLEGCSWEDIAVRMHYSPSQIKRIYFASLNTVNKIIQKNGPK